MPHYMTAKVARIDQRLSDREFKPYLDSIKYDCLVPYITVKTPDSHHERLNQLFEYL